MRAEEDTGLIPELSISFRFYYHGLMSLLCFSKSSFFSQNIIWNKMSMSKQRKEGRGLKNTDKSENSEIRAFAPSPVPPGCCVMFPHSSMCKPSDHPRPSCPGSGGLQPAQWHWVLKVRVPGLTSSYNLHYA